MNAYTTSNRLCAGSKTRNNQVRKMSVPVNLLMLLDVWEVK
ncbi:excisionase [Escherichia coli]|nr:excisionase [Escherichia coli]